MYLRQQTVKKDNGQQIIKEGNPAICNNTDDRPYMWISKTQLSDAENRLKVARGRLGWRSGGVVSEMNKGG